VPARWAQWSHARDGLEIAAMNNADVRRTLAVTVAHTYLSLVSQHRVIQVDERARDNARSHLEYTHARALGGLGSQVDDKRAAQELTAVMSQLEVAYAQLAVQQEALGVLLGVEHPLDSELSVLLETPPELQDALDDAPKLRTDLRLADLRLRAAEHVVRDEYTDYLPTIVASGAPLYYTPSIPSIPTWSWQVQLALSFTLYDGGMREGIAHERVTLRDEARINREGVARTLPADVRAALAELTHARRSTAAARASAEDAALVLSMTDQAYRAGGTTNLEVIDAERRARDADNAAAVAEDVERQATLDLLAASGRFPR
jgi:outer membrane protein TolC